MWSPTICYLSIFTLSSYFIGHCCAFIAAPQNLHQHQITIHATKETLNPLSLAKSTTLSPPSVVLKRVFEQDNRPIILFDGVCNLCNSAVNLALDWDPKGKLRFSALQSNVGRSLLQAHGRKADDISSIVLVTPEGAYVKSDAILGITQELNPVPFVPMKPLAVLGKWMVPQFLRDLIYDGVADNRYSIMGMRDECRFDSDGEFNDRFVDDDLAMDNR
jgi:predicted DCC family thiol-disulfide oxidoreductase YuxK